VYALAASDTFTRQRLQRIFTVGDLGDPIKPLATRQVAETRRDASTRPHRSQQRSGSDFGGGLLSL